MAYDKNQASISISAIKSNFVHPLLSYNFYIDGIPGVTNVSCKSASIPSVKVDKIPIKFRGRELYYNGTIAIFTDWKIDIREDIFYRSRTALESWHNLMANNIEHFGAITPIIQRDLDLYMLAPGTNVPVAHYKLFNAFPFDLGETSLSQESTTDIVEYPVTFAFDAWERQDFPISDFTVQNDAVESAVSRGTGGLDSPAM